MAEVVLSIFASSMHGRLGDNVFFRRGSNTYMRAHIPHPNQPWSASQQWSYGNFAYLSLAWCYVSDVNRQLWSSIASKAGTGHSAQGEYMKKNLVLLAANHPDLVVVAAPPAVPSTPEFPTGVIVSPIDSTSNEISWAAPFTADDYGQAWFKLDANYSSTPDRRWRLCATVRSDVGSIIHDHGYTAGVRMRYRLRMLDKSGRVSPYTHAIAVFVPA
jgi:hypothetical protein